jgi:hypothetical protein
MTVRVVQDLTDEERAQLFGWSTDAFGVERLGLQWRRKDWHVVVESDGRPVSHAGFILRQSVTVDRERLLVGGVGGVVTVPAARGRGFASAGLREVEGCIGEDREVAFAMLFCLEPLTEFYTRRGWLGVSGPVLIGQDKGACESPLPAMVRPLGQQDWPEGKVAVEGPPW